MSIKYSQPKDNNKLLECSRINVTSNKIIIRAKQQRHYAIEEVSINSKLQIESQVQLQ